MIVICIAHAKTVLAQGIPVPLGAAEVVGLNVYGRVQASRCDQLRQQQAQEAEWRRHMEAACQAEARRQEQMFRNRQAAAAKSRAEKVERQKRTREWNMANRSKSTAPTKGTVKPRNKVTVSSETEPEKQ